MQWDLGFEGLAVLAVMSLCFGAFAALVVRGGVVRRALVLVADTVACFGIGLLTSEVLFGWATGEDLQPNIDGLSRDEVLLSQVLTTVVVLLVVWHVGRRTTREGLPGGHHGRHVRA